MLAAKQKIRREDIKTEALKELYRDEDPAKEERARYSVIIQGRPVITNIVVARSGLGMKVDLERTSKRVL
jgi:hypothetical protein